jgi:hypothetical protein
MLKEFLASNAAKLVVACVCPVVAGGVALQVPKVRSAVHKATAPKVPRTARAKPRIRVPAKQEVAGSGFAPAPPMMCAASPVLAQGALKPASLDMPVSLQAAEISPAQFAGSTAVPNCGPVRFGGGGILMGMGMVPEPATWAQMIAGFALVGAGLRLRRRRQCHIRVTSLS